jgi:hypothetical protein
MTENQTSVVPWSIARKIFSYLSTVEDLQSASQVCKEWEKAASYSNSIWHNVITARLEEWDVQRRLEFDSYLSDRSYITMREAYINFLRTTHSNIVDKRIATQLTNEGFSPTKVRGVLKPYFTMILVMQPLSFLYLLIVIPFAVQLSEAEWTTAGKTTVWFFNHIFFFFPYAITFFRIVSLEWFQLRKLRKSNSVHKQLILHETNHTYLILSNLAWIPLVFIGTHYPSLVLMYRWFPLQLFTFLFVITQILYAPRSKSTGKIPWYSMTALMFLLTACLQVHMIDKKIANEYPEHITWSVIAWPSVLALVMAPFFTLFRRTTTSYCAEITFIITCSFYTAMIGVGVILLTCRYDFEWNTHVVYVISPVLLMFTTALVSLGVLVFCLVSIFDGCFNAMEQIRKHLLNTD